MGLDSTWCPEDLLAHTSTFKLPHFSTRLSRINFNLINEAENSTSNILIPTIVKVRQWKDATECVLPWLGVAGSSPAVLLAAWLPAVTVALL